MVNQQEVHNISTHEDFSRVFLPKMANPNKKVIKRGNQYAALFNEFYEFVWVCGIILRFDVRNIGTSVTWRSNYDLCGLVSFSGENELDSKYLHGMGW
jgi:hypothetical protein